MKRDVDLIRQILIDLEAHGRTNARSTRFVMARATNMTRTRYHLRSASTPAWRRKSTALRPVRPAFA